jgi:curli biogenesis system outer membrane secretion channel CsgG
MKKILIIIFSFSLSYSLIAQSEKITVGITYFTYPSYKEKNYVEQVNELVANEFVKAARFTIVDRTKLQNIKAEQELQKTEEFLDSKVIEQGRTLGAKYLVTGQLISVATSSSYSVESKKYIYSASVLTSIKLIDVETSQVLQAETFGRGQSSAPVEGGFFRQMMAGSCDVAGYGSSTDEALRNAMSNLACGLKNWVKRVFPVMVSVVEVQETHKKKGARKILIAGGTGIGLAVRKEVSIIEFVKTNVDGKELIRKKEIGKAEVIRVEDENFAICEISEGGVEIQERIDKGITLKAFVK